MTEPATAGSPTTKPLGSSQSTAAASSLALLGAVVTTVANFVIAILVSSSSNALAGVFFTGTAVATILGNSASLGTMTSLVYFLPQALRGDQPNPRALIGLALRPVAALSIGLGVVLFVVAGPFGRLVSDDAAGDLTSMLRVFAVVVPTWALTQALLGASRGLGTMGPTVGVGQVLRPGGQIVLLGLQFWRGDPSATAIAVAWSVPVLIGLGVAIVAVARLGGFQHHGPGLVTGREFWGYTRFRALSTTMQIALERIDVVIVSALLGSGPAGIYGSLSRYISAGNFLIFSVAQAMSAHLRRAISNQNMDRARQLLQRTTGWVVALAWPYFVAVAIKAEPLAELINDRYVDDANILPILALGMMVSAFAGPIDLMLLMLGRSKASLFGVTLAIATDLVLLAMLAPAFGLVGAAIAWAAGVAVQNTVASVLVYRDIGFMQVASPSLIAAVGSIATVVPIGLLTPSTFVGTALTALIALPLLVAWLLVMRDRIGLQELVPARFLNRLPAF
ncbi:MAG: polysaccharide biosynthesis C-terminal domain-containing protein [Acidimicrobiales bacterium]